MALEQDSRKWRETVHVMFLKRTVNCSPIRWCSEGTEKCRVLRIEEDDGWTFCWEIEIGLCVRGRDAMKAIEKWRDFWIGLSPCDSERLSGSLTSRSRRGQWMQVDGKR